MNLSGEIPSSRACSVDVRIQAAAKLTLDVAKKSVSSVIGSQEKAFTYVLKAFINNGSTATSSVSNPHKPTSILTRETNHPISLRNRPNTLLRLCFRTTSPRISIAFSDFGEFGVQLCRLEVVVCYRLTSISAEGVLVERVELHGVADGVFGAETKLEFSRSRREDRSDVFVWGSPARWWEFLCGGTGGHYIRMINLPHQKPIDREDSQLANASPPVTTATLHSPAEILLAASSTNFAG